MGHSNMTSTTFCKFFDPLPHIVCLPGGLGAKIGEAKQVTRIELNPANLETDSRLTRPFPFQLVWPG